jgi:hypothetical protein
MYPLPPQHFIRPFRGDMYSSKAMALREIIESIIDTQRGILTVFAYGHSDVASGLLLANCGHKSVMFCLLFLSLRVEVHEGTMLRYFTV